jgi:hypothetical protein
MSELTEAEIALRAKDLKLDEAARRALTHTPNTLTMRLVALVLPLAPIPLLSHFGPLFPGLPTSATVVLTALAGCVLGLVYEVAVLRRQVNAIVRLLRLPSASGD